MNAKTRLMYVSTQFVTTQLARTYVTVLKELDLLLSIVRVSSIFTY